MRVIVTVLLAVMLTACANSFKQFYKPYADPLTMQDVELLPEGANPAIYKSDDLKRDVGIALSKGYVMVGEASLNGALQSEAALVSQAKAIRATMVLIVTKFTDTRTVTTPLLLPNNQTTYNAGNTFGTVNNAYGRANYNGNYSGTSTTYGTTVVPITTQQQRYDQNALFFVKSTRKMRVGIQYDNLTPELRTRYERNTGVLIPVVMEGSPAFVANVLPGDVVIEVNGTPIIDRLQFQQVLSKAAASEGQVNFKLLRNGSERLISMKLPAP